MKIGAQNRQDGCRRAAAAPCCRFGLRAFSLCAISHFDPWNTLGNCSQQCDVGRLQTSSFFQGQAGLLFPSTVPMIGHKKAPQLLKQWRATSASCAECLCVPASISRGFCQCSIGEKTDDVCTSRFLTVGTIGPKARTLWPRKNPNSPLGLVRNSLRSAASGSWNFKAAKTDAKKRNVNGPESGASVVKEGQSKFPTGTFWRGLGTPASCSLKLAFGRGGLLLRKTPHRSASRFLLAIRGGRRGISRCTPQSVRSPHPSLVAGCGATSGVKRSSVRPISTLRERLRNGSAFGPLGSTVVPLVAKPVTTKGFLGSCRWRGNGQCWRGFVTISSLRGSQSTMAANRFDHV